MRAIWSTSDNKDNTSDNNLRARLVVRRFWQQRTPLPPRTRTLEQARVDGRLAEKRVEPLVWDAGHAVRDAGDEPAGHAHHANARLAGDGVRVRDGGDGANLVVRRAGEREREDAHEGPVAVVALARATAARGADAVAGRERHGGVVAPGAGGLVVRSVPRHARAPERAAGAELVRHAERVAHGLAVDAAAKGGGGMLRGGHGTHFGGRRAATNLTEQFSV